MRSVCLLAAAGAMAGLLGSAAWAQPVNDECANAVGVGEGTFTFDMAGATGNTSAGCDSTTNAPDVWFRYTAGASGTVIVSTCGLVGEGAGSTITIYASCDGASLACNANACGDGQSTVAVGVASGALYLIRIASADGNPFAGMFSVTLVPPCAAPGPGAPANDCCATAIAIGDGSAAFDTAGGTRDFAGACDQTNPNPDVWFRYTAPTTGFARVRPGADAPQDMGVTVLDGSCGGPVLACGADYLWADDFRQVVFPTVAGNVYLIRLQHLVYYTDPPETTGAGHILVESVAPPANDDCASATPIAGVGSFAYDNTLANDSGPDDAPGCNFPVFGIPVMGIAHDVWFRWTSNLPIGQDAVVSTCGGTRVDTKIAVYDRCPGDGGTLLGCNDDACFSESTVRFTPAPGATYLVRIGNWPGVGSEPAPDGKPGSFTVSTQPTCALVPPPGAMIEPEPCGQDSNGGCGTGGFTDVPCGVTTIYGTAPVNAGVPDLDYYRMTLTAASHVVFKGTAEFPMRLAVLDGQCNPMNTWRFPSGPCEDPELNPLETDLLPGTYLFGVANTLPDSPCGAKNHYIVTIQTATCCRADIDQSGGLNVQDIFDFLTAWFNGDPRADFDGADGITVQDVFAFLSAWFAGC